MAPAAGTLDSSIDSGGGDGGVIEGTSSDAADSFRTLPAHTYAWSLSTSSDNIPWSGWAACGLFDSKYKHVKDYHRANLDPRMVDTYARLYCGMKDSTADESKFGYFHIKDAHMADWQNKADYINRQWQDLLGYVFTYTFNDPGKVTKSSSIRFCYQRMFYLVDNNTGDVVNKMRAIVYTGETGRRIMTAFPTNPDKSNPYTCKGTVVS